MNTCLNAGDKICKDVKSEDVRLWGGGNWNKIPAWVKGKNPECASYLVKI